jgi:hypothetical protein
MVIQQSASGIPWKLMTTASTMGEEDVFGLDEANVTFRHFVTPKGRITL